MNLNKLILLFISLLASNLLMSQSTIRGYIYDAKNGEPIGFSTVFIEGTNFGATSDIAGFFNISGVPAGKFKLVADLTGYEKFEEEIDVKLNSILAKTIYLNVSDFQLGEVEISASKQAARTEILVSKITVTPKQIKSLPSIGGEADIAQYLQILPGVVSTGDQGGQIFIRGGAPVQNKILLDGLNIYNPFHSLGFFSVFETEVIRNVDVYTGGFTAEYGGRTSAVIDIKTKEGNKKNLSGYVSGSPFMGKILLEAPISKFEQGKGSASIIVTGKKSIIENTSKQLYKYAAEPDSLGLPFSFSDFYSKLSFISGSGSKLNIFGFNFKDQYNNPAVSKIGWNNQGFGADFSVIPGSSDIIIKGTVGYTKYDLAIQESIDKRSSAIKEFGANIDFLLIKEKSEVKYGFDLKAITTDFEFINPFGVPLGQNQNTTEFGIYGKYKRTIGNLLFEPSIRMMYYAGQSAFSPEPRIAMKYNASQKLRLKASGGFYSQNIISTSNERDVVNLFYGFLTGPETQLKGLDGKTLGNNLQFAKHAVVGFEYDLGPKVLLNIEGYLKDFNQVIVINRNKLDVKEPDYVSEVGEAYGIDMSIKAEAKKWNFYTSYTYGFVNRNDGNQIYPTLFDRRHNLNSLISYSLDKKGDFTVSARWNLGSGFPFTKTQGFYNKIDFLDGANTNYVTSNPKNVGILYSDTRNGGRLPYYHRFDVSANKKITFSKSTYLEVNASVTNVYNRENIFYFDRVKFDRVNQLPIIPAVSLKLGF
jgi:hypothetical protein